MLNELFHNIRAHGRRVGARKSAIKHLTCGLEAGGKYFGIAFRCGKQLCDLGDRSDAVRPDVLKTADIRRNVCRARFRCKQSLISAEHGCHRYAYTLFRQLARCAKTVGRCGDLYKRILSEKCDNRMRFLDHLIPRSFGHLNVKLLIFSYDLSDLFKMSDYVAALARKYRGICGHAADGKIVIEIFYIL